MNTFGVTFILKVTFKTSYCNVMARWELSGSHDILKLHLQ